MDSKCIIWGTEAGFKDYLINDDKHFFSPRAGGKYIVDYVRYMANFQNGLNLKDEEKIRLSGYIAKENLNGRIPKLDEETLSEENLPPIPDPRERAYLLLEGLVKKTDKIGVEFLYDGLMTKHKDFLPLFALSYSNKPYEILCLLDYLKDLKFIKDTNYSFQVAVKGFEKIDELSRGVDSHIAFIAMWINSRTNDLYSWIKEAIEKAGYKPLRIDQKDHINKIDDEIIVEINKARFVICDLTSEEGKPRGSVYFEAGYAMGKDIPIIWTCRKEAIKDESQKSQSKKGKLQIELPFDIRQYNCLVWEDSEKDDFIKRLKSRIENAIGPGPLKEKQSKDKIN